MVRMCVMLRMLRLHRYQKEETVDADPTLPCSLLSPPCPPPPHTHTLLPCISQQQTGVSPQVQGRGALSGGWFNLGQGKQIHEFF